MKQTNLFILSNGKVACINKKDGSILWEIKINQYAKSIMTGAIGQISLEGDKLFIGISGVLVCLYAKDGSLVWINELKGWGFGFVSMANVNNEAANAVALQAAAAAAIIAGSAAGNAG